MADLDSLLIDETGPSPPRDRSQPPVRQNDAAVAPEIAPSKASLRSALADHQAGRLERAERAYRALLEVDPKSFDALHMLGVLAHQSGRHREAVALIGQALSVNARVAEAHYNQAVALQAAGRAEAAIEAHQRAKALRPDYPEADLNLGVLLRNQGRLTEAEAAYRRAVGRRPDLAMAHNNLGSLLEVFGRFEEAVACWRTAIEVKPDYAEAYRNLAQHQVSALDDNHVAAMEQLLAGSRLPERERVYLSFALAEVYEARGDYDAAFAMLRNGNAMRRRSIPFSIEAERAIAASLMDIFNLGTLGRSESRCCPSDLPILIVGMPRSGTSLVEQILASHPQVFGAGELTHIGELARPYLRHPGGLPYWNWGPDQEDLRGLGEAYVAKLRALAPDARHVVDKMPHNFLFLGFLRSILPQAKIIHVRRDPIDTCLACYKRLFNTGQNFSYDLAELGTYYRIYDGLMAHWHRVIPDAILDVAYEDLVANPKRVVQATLAHCGLPWDEACLAFHRTDRPVRTASAAQVRKPLYGSSVGRWQHYEKHLAPLILALGSSVPPCAER